MSAGIPVEVLPTVVVLAMGGAIAGSAASTTDSTGYRAATASIDDLLDSVPEVRDLARIRGEQFAQIDSSDLTDQLLLHLTDRVNALTADPTVDGVVITHGTDTLEESAYFLHLTVKSAKPVVLVGSMRPATALSADGPRNLFAAITVAAAKEAHGHGVLVVMNDEIHSARDVTKTSSLRLDAFGSPYGQLGTVVDTRAAFFRSVTRPHRVSSEFAVTGLTTLPRTAIIFAHAGLDDGLAAVFDVTHYDAIVHARFGNGTVSQRMISTLERASTAGTLIVRASRTGSGQVTDIGASAGATQRLSSSARQTPTPAFDQNLTAFSAQPRPRSRLENGDRFVGSFWQKPEAQCGEASTSGNVFEVGDLSSPHLRAHRMNELFTDTGRHSPSNLFDTDSGDPKQRRGENSSGGNPSSPRW